MGSDLSRLQRTPGGVDSTFLFLDIPAQHHSFWADAPISLLSFQSAHADFTASFFSDGGSGWIH